MIALCSYNCFPAFAAESARKALNLPAAPAESALKQLATQSGVSVLFTTEMTAGVRTRPVRGEHTALEAANQMLAGTKLVASQDAATGAITISRASEGAAGKNAASPLPAAPQTEIAPPRNAAVAIGGTGTVTGRVFNTANGEFVENARVVVEGTALETFTDATGSYRLPQVPAGVARVSVFFTGLARQSEAIQVTPGATAQHDFNLALGGDANSVVKLSAFVVGARREMDAAAMAINEQRFSANMKNVVAVEEFGTVAEGNVAEVLKFMPGLTVNYGAGDASTVSIGGVPSAYVPVTVGGFSLATAASASTSREVQFEQFSINNIARIEVLHSPTPESSGAALAGSVNLVTRSAFERAKPIFNYSAYAMMRDAEKSLDKTPGPFRKPTRKILPGFDFSYIRPVNARFGFTLSGGYNAQYGPQDQIILTWRGSGAATNGTTLPDTTPDRPYLTDLTVKDGSKLITRSNVGATFDYKLTRDDRISFSILYAVFENEFRNRNLNYLVNAVLPGNFSPTFTRGATGAGEIRLSQGASRKHTKSYMPTLSYRHDGPVWKADAGVGYSYAINRYTNASDGFFDGITSRRTGVTVSFEDNFYLRPRVITVSDGATGAPVDPGRLESYALNAATGGERTSSDGKRSAFLNAGRRFDLGQLPAAFKGGLDVVHQNRDVRTVTRSYTFVGADGRATTTPRDPLGSDDSPVALLDESFSQRSVPYGFGRVQWVGYESAYELFEARPQYFTNVANNDYRSGVSGSKFAEETISSAYVRGDLSLLQRRLKLIGGVRAEQTNVHAEGPLNDPTGNYQRNAAGAVILGPNGSPLLRVPTTDALGVSRLTFIDRGQASRKEYLRFFPSLNASYELRENFILRGAYYRSIGRPDFNQYAGGITLPDTERSPSSTNRIGVNNAGIKAWSADTVRVRLEYYLEPVGQFTVSAFRRDYENFFGTTSLPASPAFLAFYGLDAATYGAYEVATQYNLPSKLHTYGFDFDYKQVLTFLPSWARGVQVFANASTTRVTGAETQNFLGYIPRSGSLGISLTRERFNLRLNWNFRSRARRNEITGRSIEPGTFEWRNSRSLFDAQGDWNLSRRFALFFNLRNIADLPEDVERLGPHTPEVAQFRQRENWGALWTFGLKGSF